MNLAFVFSFFVAYKANFHLNSKFSNGNQMRFCRDAEDAQRVGTRFKGNAEIRVRFGFTAFYFSANCMETDPFGDETTTSVLSAQRSGFQRFMYLQRFLEEPQFISSSTLNWVLLLEINGDSTCIQGHLLAPTPFHIQAEQ